MNLVITMSRRFGTGASIIAKELSERLHIPVYDKDDVEHGMRENAFESEADAIRELAKQPCIIIGRCASEFLKDKSNVINIYVCADKEDRIKRILQVIPERIYHPIKERSRINVFIFSPFIISRLMMNASSVESSG